VTSHLRFCPCHATAHWCWGGNLISPSLCRCIGSWRYMYILRPRLIVWRRKIGATGFCSFLDCKVECWIAFVSNFFGRCVPSHFQCRHDDYCFCVSLTQSTMVVCMYPISSVVVSLQLWSFVQQFVSVTHDNVPFDGFLVGLSFSPLQSLTPPLT